MLRIDKFCHAMYTMEYKYTDTVTLSLGIEVGMFPLFVLTCMVISLCNVRCRISGLNRCCAEQCWDKSCNGK